MKWRWSGVVFAVWASLLPVLAIVVSAPPAKAAVPVDINATYRFVDANSVETTDGNLFYGNNPSGSCVGRGCQAPTRTWRLNLTNDKDGCQDYLTVTYSTATKRITGMVYSYSTANTDTTQSRCSPVSNRNILSLNKFDTGSMQWYDAIYEWRNINLIQNLETKGTFARNTTGNTSVFTEVGKTQCASTLTVNSSTQGTLIARSVNGATCNVAAARTVDLARPNNMNIPAGSNTPTPSGGGDGDGETSDPVTCDAGGALTWLVCSVIEFSLGVIDFIRDEFILPVLEVPPLTSRDDTLFKVWENMRNLASLFFILLFLLTIFGTAIGYDNYTIKKVLPRIVTGAVLLPLSWPLSAAFIDLGNIFGQGLITLLEPIINAGGPPNIDFTRNMTDLFLGAGGTATGIGILALAVGSSAVGAITGLGLATILSFLFSILAAFMTIVFRQLLIVVLVVLSPIALAAWILPNTQSFSKMWVKNYFRVIMMYPLFVLLLEGGRLAAKVAEGIAPTGDPTSIVASVVVPYIQIVCLAGALIALPFTLKWPGGIFAAGVGGINKAKSWGNKQVGRGSNFDKDRQRLRELRNINRSKNLESKATAAELAGKKGRARAYRAFSYAARSRSGKGGKGITGWGGLAAGNELEQDEFEKAYDTAAGVAGRKEARKNINPDIPKESHQERVQAEAYAAAQSKAEGRAKRAGLRDGVNQAGSTTSFVVDTYKAVQEDTRQSTLAGIGKNRATVNKLGTDPLRPEEILGASIADQEKNIEANFGKIRGTVTGERELDYEERVRTEMAALQGTAVGRNMDEATLRARAEHNLRTGSSLTRLNNRQARLNRLSAYQASAASKARGAAGAAEGEALEGADYGRTVGAQAMSEIVGGTQLAERERISAQRAQLSERVAVNRDPAARMTRSQVLASAQLDARDRFAAAAGNALETLDAEHAQEQLAHTTGDDTLAPSIRNKVLASREKAKEHFAAEQTVDTAAARAALGYGGKGPSTNSYEDIFKARLLKAEMDKSKNDDVVRNINSGVKENEERMMDEMQTEENRQAAIAGRPSRTISRAEAHAKLIGEVGEAAGSSAKGEVRTTFNTAIGENIGELQGGEEIQTEMEADRLMQDPSFKGDRNAALNRARQNILKNKENAQKGLPTDQAVVTLDAALDAYRDRRAATVREDAAQKVSASTGKVYGEGEALDAANREGLAQFEADRLQRQDPSLSRLDAVERGRKIVAFREDQAQQRAAQLLDAAAQREATRLMTANKGLTRDQALAIARKTTAPDLSADQAIRQARASVAAGSSTAPTDPRTGLNRVVQAYSTAARENAQRSSTATTGNTFASVDAASSDNRPTLDARVAAANDAGKTQIGSEEANVLAYQQEGIKGRTYEEVRTAAVKSKSDQLLSQRIAEESISKQYEVEIEDPNEPTGKRTAKYDIARMPLTGPGIEILADFVGKAKENPARAIAAAQRISQSSNTGLRTLILAEFDTLNGDPANMTDPVYSEIWAKMTANAKSKLVKKPLQQAVEDLSSVDIASMEKSEAEAMLMYYQLQTQYTNNRVEEAAEKARTAPTQAERDEALEKLKVAQKARTKVTLASDRFNEQLAGAVRDKNTRKRMSSELLETLEKAIDGNLESVFNFDENWKLKRDTKGKPTKLTIQETSVPIQEYDESTGQPVGDVQSKTLGIRSDVGQDLKAFIKELKEAKPTTTNNSGNSGGGPVPDPASTPTADDDDDDDDDQP